MYKFLTRAIYLYIRPLIVWVGEHIARDNRDTRRDGRCRRPEGRGEDPGWLFNYS